MSRLGDRLRRHARNAPDERAVHAGERWWSYRELVTAAEQLALEVGAGDVVAIAMDRGIEAVLAVCAAGLAGAIPALLDPHDRELAARTLAGLRPAVVLVAPGDAELPGARVVVVGGGPPAAGAPASWEPVRRAPGIAHIVFTSGSTAAGKGVVWSELRAGHDWRISAPRRRTRRRRPAGIVVPLCTALGYHELVRSLHHRTPVALLDAPFPAALAQARALRVGRMRLTPTHVELLLATAEELPHLRAIAVASAPIAPDRLRALAARVPGARIGRSYGLTESGAATAVWLHRRPNKLHSVGRSVAYRRVTVRDEAGRMLPPGQNGEVVIEMPVWDACDGYLDAPPELASRFDNGVLWTGDRGRIDEHGFLVLASRAAEILKVGGRSVGAPRIEETVAALPGVAAVVVVGVPDRLLGEVPCAVVAPAAGASARRIADGLDALELRPDERPRWLLARRELPRTASGKLRRGQLAREAAQWTQAFGRPIAPGHRAYPAYDLDGGAAIVDGCPAEWLAAARVDGGGLDPCARLIALVAREPLQPLALAIVQAGAPGVRGGVRFVVGPAPVPLPGGRITDALLDVFTGELITLAGLLPGPRPERTCAFAGGPRRALAGAGFAVIAGSAGSAGSAGWVSRPEGDATRPAAEPGETELAGLAAVFARLVEWAREAGEAADDARRRAEEAGDGEEEELGGEGDEIEGDEDGDGGGDAA